MQQQFGTTEASLAILRKLDPMLTRNKERSLRGSKT